MFRCVLGNMQYEVTLVAAFGEGGKKDEALEVCDGMHFFDNQHKRPYGIYTKAFPSPCMTADELNIWMGKLGEERREISALTRAHKPLTKRRQEALKKDDS